MKWKHLNLSPELRRKLKNFIPPVENLDSLTIKKNLNKKVIVCVGDKTSEEVLKKGIIKPKICIYDGKVMRKVVGISETIKNFNAREIKVKNPPGTLTRELFDAIKEGFNCKENVKISVDGEEDLATLPAIHFAPLNSLILYGEPGKGLVAIEVNKEIKEKVKEILNEMSK